MKIQFAAFEKSEGVTGIQTMATSTAALDEAINKMARRHVLKLETFEPDNSTNLDFSEWRSGPSARRGAISVKPRFNGT